MMKRAICIAMLSFVAAACSINPVRVAETPEQKAYASYGTFVIYEEGAANIVQDAATPAAVKEGIKKADAVTKPAADKLLDAAIQVSGIAAQLKEGETVEDTLRIARDNLNTWLQEAVPLINDFKALVKRSK